MLKILLGRKSTTVPAPTASSGSAGAVAAGVADYWTRHNVTLHHQFSSAEESLAYLRWRNDQYFGYAEQMPLDGHEGKRILDYGCGPGHDLVGFGVYSRPERLVGCDVSSRSLEQARRRLALHDIRCELMLLDAGAGRLPFKDASFDYIHTSGVLHHTHDPVGILREFARILDPHGCVRVMVYNYDSIWLHLYVAYQKMIEESRYADQSVREAFAKTTDGEDCPIARVYRTDEFLALAAEAGFDGTCTGAAVSVFEASLVPTRFRAIMDRRLPEEHRKFLVALEFDRFGLPLTSGRHAGVDGCYLLTPRI
jgi:SAM-dependent methyltransferase